MTREEVQLRLDPLKREYGEAVRERDWDGAGEIGEKMDVIREEYSLYLDGVHGLPGRPYSLESIYDELTILPSLWVGLAKRDRDGAEEKLLLSAQPTWAREGKFGLTVEDLGFFRELVRLANVGAAAEAAGKERGGAETWRTRGPLL